MSDQPSNSELFHNLNFQEHEVVKQDYGKVLVGEKIPIRSSGKK